MNVYSGFNNYMYEQFFRKHVTRVLIQNTRLSMLQKQRKTTECDTEGREGWVRSGANTSVIEKHLSQKRLSQGRLGN